VSSAYQAAALIWFAIFAYALAGSVDLGATVWRMVFARRGDAEAEAVAAKYVSPLWEAANVFLVLVAVGLVGFFPGASYAYGTVLLVPGSAILILLALRGSFLAYAHAGPRPPRAFWDVTGVTGLLLPALLVAVMPISTGGFVQAQGGRLALDAAALLGSPVVYAYVVFGVGASLFISAAFLADYARTAGRETAYATYRRQALWAGPVMIIAGVAALFLIPSPAAAWLQPRLQAEWPWFLASLAAFALGLSALWWPAPGATAPGRPRWAVVLVGLQLLCADVGYGWAHAPWLLYPEVSTAGGFSNQAMFAALLWVVVVGLAVIAPGFVWLWRLFVLDPRYTRR
jgi:cytochrome d ubiquinol oxidase subunit II